MKKVTLSRAIVWSLSALLFPLLAACGSSAQVTSTPAAATTIAIALHPTTVPRPTTVPSATSAPQPTAVPTTVPIPTVEVTLKSLTGLWERSDQQRGQLYLFFSEQGTYKAAHGTPRDTVHAGAFEMNGTVLNFLDGWDECAQGSYELRIISVAGKDVLVFVPADDSTCADRVEGLRGRWSRFIRP
jgi:hypothetical protein